MVVATGFVCGCWVSFAATATDACFAAGFDGAGDDRLEDSAGLAGGAADAKARERQNWSSASTASGVGVPPCDSITDDAYSSRSSEESSASAQFRASSSSAAEASPSWVIKDRGEDAPREQIWR